MDSKEGSPIDTRFTPFWHIAIAVLACIILFLIGPVDLSSPHLVKPTLSEGIVVIILLIAIWFAPNSPTP